MDRRKFIRYAGTGAAAGALADVLAERAESAVQRSPKQAVSRKAAMKVGHQHDHSTDSLTLFAGLGLNNICSGLPSAKFDEKWSVAALTQFRERIEAFGIRLDMVPLPLSSSYITRAENPNIMLGKSPERDREIANICQMIRNAALAGIPALKNNMSILGEVSTEAVKCRGNASCRASDYRRAKQ